MDIYKLCSQFLKFAQQAAPAKKIVLDPKQKNINFYTKFLSILLAENPLLVSPIGEQVGDEARASD